MTTERLHIARGLPENQGPGVLSKAIAELKANPFSPEANTNYWRAKIQTDGKRIEPGIFVLDCNWTEGEIRRPMKDNKGDEAPSMLVYDSKQLRGKRGLVRLGQMYPEMGSWSVQEGTTVQDSSDTNERDEWVKVEATVDAPNLDTTQKDLEEHAKKQGYSGQQEAIYILASKKSKDLTGYYLDEEGTFSRLGSRRKGVVVSVSFHSDGHLFAHWNLSPWHHLPHLGGRFVEVKKA